MAAEVFFKNVTEDAMIVNATNYDLKGNNLADLISKCKPELDYGKTVTAFVIAFGIVKMVDIKKGYTPEYGPAYVVDYHFVNEASSAPMLMPEDYERAKMIEDNDEDLF